MFSLKINLLTVRVHVLIENLQVMDIASLAKKQYTYKSTRLIDWEQKFRDKLTTKTKGGPFQLRKFWKLFDLDGNGAVTIDEMLKVAEGWNLYAADNVAEQLRRKYCRPEHQVRIV